MNLRLITLTAGAIIIVVIFVYWLQCLRLFTFYSLDNIWLQVSKQGIDHKLKWKNHHLRGEIVMVAV
jgi:hypothetical protein